MVLCLAISALMIVSLWKIFSKNNKPGWYSLIPFFNMWTLFEIVGVQGWWCLIPFANIVFMYICNYKLAIKMGRSQGMAIVTTLFPAVGYPILAFSKNKGNDQVVTANANLDNQVVNGVNQTVNNTPLVTPVVQDVNNIPQVTPVIQDVNNIPPVTPAVQDINNVPPVTPVVQDVNNVVSESNQGTMPEQQINLQPQPIQSVPSVSAFCPNCGAQVNPDAIFCTGCGNKLK